jgi:hypothetical protein
MTPTDFVHWMRGFVTACPKFHPTPEQWDLLVEQLSKVEDKTFEQIPRYNLGPFEMGGIGTTTGMPVFDQGTKELIKG